MSRVTFTGRSFGSSFIVHIYIRTSSKELPLVVDTGDLNMLARL